MTSCKGRWESMRKMREEIHREGRKKVRVKKTWSKRKTGSQKKANPKFPSWYGLKANLGVQNVIYRAWPTPPPFKDLHGATQCQCGCNRNDVVLWSSWGISEVQPNHCHNLWAVQSKWKSFLFVHQFFLQEHICHYLIPVLTDQWLWRNKTFLLTLEKKSWVQDQSKTSSWRKTFRRKEKSIELKTEQGDGLQDRDQVIYKGVIMTILKYKEQKALREKYANDQAIIYWIGKIRKQKRLPISKKRWVTLMNLTKGLVGSCQNYW